MVEWSLFSDVPFVLLSLLLLLLFWHFGVFFRLNFFEHFSKTNAKQSKETKTCFLLIAKRYSIITFLHHLRFFFVGFFSISFSSNHLIHFELSLNFSVICKTHIHTHTHTARILTHSHSHYVRWFLLQLSNETPSARANYCCSSSHRSSSFSLISMLAFFTHRTLFPQPFCSLRIAK